jgi:Acetyltransferases, including N-acetylases of ribosomal proteins
MIKTDRLILRAFTLDDLDSLFSIFSDPDVVRYLGYGTSPSRLETQAILNSYFAHWQKRGFGRWGLVCKQSGQLIGYCGLRWRDHLDSPEIVYLLAKEFWGKGLATEAARACLRYGFERLGFERIIAVTRPENVASQRVMEKIGMGYEGTTRLDDMDLVVYAIWRKGYEADSSTYEVDDD